MKAMVLWIAFASVTAPTLASDCGSSCVQGITNIWLGKYTQVIHDVFNNLTEQLQSRVFPPNTIRSPASQYLQPLLDAYNSNAHTGLSHAIFTDHFHGECRNSTTGVVPQGCLDSDCPIVCGSPGSLVHFFPTLRAIAFKQTRDSLLSISRPDSRTYKQVEHFVLADATRNRHPVAQRRKYPMPTAPGPRAMPGSSPESVRENLQSVLADVAPLLGRTCGYDADTLPFEATLSWCSWEDEIKSYILRFAGTL